METRASPSRAPVLSFAHYFQAPAKQAKPQRSFNLFLFQKKVNNTPVKATHNVSSASVLMVHLKKAPLVGVKSINNDSLGPEKTAPDRLIEVIFTEIKANDFCHVDE